jgi:hypothetical protein
MEMEDGNIQIKAERTIIILYYDRRTCNNIEYADGVD